MSDAKNIFPINEIWEKIPWALFPPSAKVDLCLFLSGIKPAVRTQIQDKGHLNFLASLFSSLGWYLAYDEDGYIVIAADRNLADVTLQVDQSSLPHESQLGALLGYPKCCYEYMAQQGENKIDEVAENFKEQDLKEEYGLIDVSLYDQGISLISHVPCSPQCSPSLEVAQFLQKFIVALEVQGSLLEWCKHIRNHFRF